MSREKRDIASVPYDIRQFMPTECVWLQMSAHHGRKQINASAPETYDVGEGCTLSASASSTLTHFVNTGEEPSAYWRLAIANATANSRAYIGHNRSNGATSFALGKNEADVTTRVRFNSTDTSGSLAATAMVGFFDTNAAMSSQLSACCFYTTNLSKTWECKIFGTGGAVEYDKSFNTGISSTEWRDLSVWASNDGKKAVFTIDSQPVWSLADSGLTDLNNADRSGGGAKIRRIATGNGSKTFDVAWYLERHFCKR